MSATLDSDDELDRILDRLVGFHSCGVPMHVPEAKAALNAWKAKGERRARRDVYLEMSKAISQGYYNIIDRTDPERPMLTLSPQGLASHRLAELKDPKAKQ